MSMIFEAFPSMVMAEAFVAEAKLRFGLDGQTFTTDDASNADDPHPSVSVPPIAHIARVDDHNLTIGEAVAAEDRVHALAAEFGGRYTGT